MQAAVLPLWLYSLTGSTQLALGSFVADALVRAVVSPVLGSLVSKYAPLKILVITDGLSFMLTILLATTVRQGSQVWLVFLLTSLITLSMQGNQLALQVLIPRFFTKERLKKINGNMQTCLSALSMLAPPAASILGTVVDWKLLIFINAGSFLISLLLVSVALPKEEWNSTNSSNPSAGHPLSILARHWNDFRHNPLAGIIFVESLLFVFFGASQALLYGTLIESGHEQGGSYVAVLLFGAGAGAILGGLFLRRLGSSTNLILMIVGGLSMLGPVLVVVGLHTSVILGVIGTAAVGASGNLLIGGITTAIQEREDPGQMAMTLGVRRGMAGIGQVLCYAWVLGLASVVGYWPVYVGAGAAAFLASIIGVSRVRRKLTQTASTQRVAEPQ
jgi:MFS family permease